MEQFLDLGQKSFNVNITLKQIFNVELEIAPQIEWLNKIQVKR